MAKKEYFLWIQKVIASCETLRQCDSCRNIISTYYKRWNNRMEAELLLNETNAKMNAIWVLDDNERKSWR